MSSEHTSGEVIDEATLAAINKALQEADKDSDEEMALGDDDDADQSLLAHPQPPVAEIEHSEQPAAAEDENQNVGNSFFGGRVDGDSYVVYLRIGHIVNFGVLLYLAAMAIVLTACLAVEWDAVCEKHIHMWAVTQVILQGVMILVKAVKQWRTTRADVFSVPWESLPVPTMRLLRVLSLANRLSNFLYGVWFIVGMILLFSNNRATCTATHLARAILVQFFIQWAFVGVTIFTVCCVVGIVAILYCVNPAMFRQGQHQGATKSQIDKLKEFNYNPQELSTIKPEDASCAICLENYEVDDKVKFLPCGHHFHTACSTEWLQRNSTCPFCKRDITEDSDSPPPKKAAEPSPGVDLDELV